MIISKLITMQEEQQENNFTPNESLKVIADMIEKVQNDKLRRLARKRVSFKQSVVYLSIVSIMLTAIWYFTSGFDSYFWPAWPIGSFIFVIVMSYLDAYMNTSLFSEDKEYEKLKSQTTKINN